MHVACITVLFAMAPFQIYELWLTRAKKSKAIQVTPSGEEDSLKQYMKKAGLRLKQRATFLNPEKPQLKMEERGVSLKFLMRFAERKF